MSRIQTPLALALASLLVAGCAMRSSTTDRTAIEQALMSKAASRTVGQMYFKTLEGKSFFMKEDKFEAVDGKYVAGEIRNRLLDEGLTAAAKEEDSDLLVWPRSAAHGVDDSKFLIGIPKIPIPVPTVGTIETPELAIFKLERQRGRNRMAVEVEDRSTGRLLLGTGEMSATSRYDRWVILILFGFSKTDLGKPF